MFPRSLGIMAFHAINRMSRFCPCGTKPIKWMHLRRLYCDLHSSYLGYDATSRLSWEHGRIRCLDTQHSPDVFGMEITISKAYPLLPQHRNATA